MICYTHYKTLSVKFVENTWKMVENLLKYRGLALSKLQSFANYLWSMRLSIYKRFILSALY